MKYVILFILSLLPSITYATQPVVIVNQNVIRRHIVEFDANTYLGINGYYGAMDKAKLELSNQYQVDATNLKTLLEIVKSLLDKQCQNGTPINTTQPNPVNTPIIAPTPVEQPKVDELDKAVYNIFKTNCITCHGPDKISGGLQLVTKDGLFDLPALKRYDVHFRVNGSNTQKFGKQLMPLGGKPLSDTDVNTIYDWATSKLLAELKK